MHLFCPICNCPCSPAGVICDDCKRELDMECLDSSLDRCPSCHSPLVDRTYSCSCNNSPDFPKIHSVARYDGKLSYSIIDSFKFHSRKELAPVIAHYLKQALYCLDPEGMATIVPVPCSEARRKHYGWDQMVEVAEALKLPYVKLLRNNRQADIEQKKLDRQGRMERAKDRFILNPGIGEPELCRLKDKPVIVIDDIVTTKSTMLSAMRTLKDNGFSNVQGASWLCEL